MANVAPMRTDYAPLSDVNTTRSLARFAVNTRFEDLPPAVLNQTRRLLFDCLGVAFGAADEPDLPIMLDFAGAMGGDPQATIWMTDKRMNVLQAALINGQTANILNLNDTFLSDTLVYHGGPQVIAPALAIAEWRARSGRDFVTAVAIGYEIALRVVLSFGITWNRRRWHAVSMGGPFSAAAACGKLLNLDEQRMHWALGLAGQQAGGVIEGLGSMGGGFQYSRSAAAGTTAALLAERNFTGPEDILTGRFGLHTVFHSDQNLAMLTDELGTRWEMLKSGFKPYACGINLHALISGLIALRNEFHPAPEAVTEIVVRVNPHVLVPSGVKEPRSGREGKFSVYYTAAAALIDGDAGPAQYTDARVREPVVNALRRRVRVETDEAMRRDEAVVAVHLRDGRKLERHVKHAPGTIEAPMTDAELEARCRAFAGQVVDARQTDKLLDAIGGIENLQDAGGLARLMARPS